MGIDQGVAAVISGLLSFGSGLAVGYREEIKRLIRPRTKAGSRDLSGRWKGKGEDLEVDSCTQFQHLNLKKINTYDMTLELDQTDALLTGKCEVITTVGNLRLDLTGKFICDDYIMFDYKASGGNNVHNGAIILYVRGDSKLMEGYFLTKRLLDVGIGFGCVSFSFQGK